MDPIKVPHVEKFGQAAQSVLGAVGNGAFTDSDIKDPDTKYKR